VFFKLKNEKKIKPALLEAHFEFLGCSPLRLGDPFIPVMDAIPESEPRPDAVDAM